MLPRRQKLPLPRRAGQSRRPPRGCDPRRREIVAGPGSRRRCSSATACHCVDRTVKPLRPREVLDAGGSLGRRRQHIPLGRELVLLHDADRAGHAVRAVVAVTAGVLVEVLLVVALRVVEGASLIGGAKFGGDVTKTVALQHDLERVTCLLYTSPSPRDRTRSRMPSS